uniref:Uncharacterized protein n=1 Tax=Tanacetum cinerariifolium TaxID=118510 RepID=A0A699HQX2_TANCI|nr:hypothetical protein CTI12_AA602070 [Tanacetum cinerariifolium]
MSNQENEYTKPMQWVGIYIVVASMVCILAMVADLLQGFRNRKLWFPCIYFTFNAASLAVIAIAMKLPMDLNNSMPGDVDHMEKLGSMAFMCTTMANLLPSLATMNSKELLTNIMALDILDTSSRVNNYMLLVLLIIPTCSALNILKSKQILELKYKTSHEAALKDLELQQPEVLSVEKLKQHAKNHWIMACTGSP